ncbi:MAG: hypothetical protein K2Q18_06880 [Bdellovibrionales bacterium]|nr:hypothetical protein [Bdellovibrionales bacterium]
MANNIQQFILIIMDFSKTLDFVTPQDLKDIIKNLQGRNAELIDENEDLYSESEKNKKRIQELEDYRKK